MKAISRAALAASLTSLGLARGNTVMVHASLRKLGPIEGRASGVIDAIRDVIGTQGTMLMMVAADDDEPFDRFETEADEDNGVLAEVFRRSADVEVNDHPACRFAACGPAAAELLEPQPVDDYYGPGSPLERFVALAGVVLRLGANIDTVTLTHHAEYLARVADKRTVRRRYVRADIGEIWINSLDDSGGIADWHRGDYFGQIYLDFIAGDRARTGNAGRCTAELLDGRTFVEFAVAWLEREFGY